MQQQLRIKPYVKHLNWLVILVIAGNKFWLRPWVREHVDSSLLLIVVNSLPNFVEAVIGTVALAGIGLVLRTRFPQHLSKFSDRVIYAIATIMASIYVISQELNFHSLGGNNTYDPYDLVASVIGLVTAAMVLHTHGLLADQHT